VGDGPVNHSFVLGAQLPGFTILTARNPGSGPTLPENRTKADRACRTGITAPAGLAQADSDCSG